MSINFDPGLAEDIFTDISVERARQDSLRDMGKFRSTPTELAAAGRLSDTLTVLSEEFGEVARVVCESIEGNLDTEHLREELVQLAACCVGWVEAIDRADHSRCSNCPPEDGPISLPSLGVPDWCLPPCGAD